MHLEVDHSRLQQPGLKRRLGFASQLLAYGSTLPLAAIAFCAAVLTLASLRLAGLSDAQAPPGADGGNWLAYARDLFGDHVKAAAAIYPPVLPFLLRLLLILLPPLEALKVLGVASWALMAVPLFLVLRRDLNPVISMVLALAFVMAGYQAEIQAFGGYPDLLGTAFLLFSLYWLGPALRDRNKQALLLSAIAGSLAIGTHQGAAAQLVVASFIFAGYFALQRPVVWRAVAARFARWAVATTALSLVFAPFYIRMILLLDRNPNNPQGYSLTSINDALAYALSEHHLLWLTLAAAAFAAPLLVIRFRRDSLLAPTAASLLLTPLLLFAVTGEVRNFQLMEAGIIVSLGLIASSVIASFRAVSATWRWATWLGWPTLAVGAACLAIAVPISLSGQDRAQVTFSYYRVLDDKAVEALNWLRGQETGIVVANTNPLGYQYGWWIEGYAGRPTYNAADPRWFNFREEREQVMIANDLLAPMADPYLIAVLAEARKVRYVFLDRRTHTRTAGLIAAGFKPAYQNGQYVILSRVNANVVGGGTR